MKSGGTLLVIQIDTILREKSNKKNHTSDTVHPSSSRCETALRTEETTSESTPLPSVS